MTHREPFGLGTLITDFLWFLVKRAHLVIGLLCLQFLISFVLMVILGLYEFDERKNLQAVASTILVLVPLAFLSAYTISASNWRRQAKVGWRSLLKFRLKGILPRLIFVIAAFGLTVAAMLGTGHIFQEWRGDGRGLLIASVGYNLLPIALGPLYMRDLYPNPWTATGPYLKGIHKIAPGMLVFAVLVLILVTMLIVPLHATVGSSLLVSFLSVYTPKQEHFLLLQDADGFLFIQTLIFLQLIAAAFLFERFKEITYGRDLSHVVEAF